MKKTDNDRGYLDFIKRVAVDYKNQKGLLKSKINDEEFMNAQEEITKELFNRLSLEEDKNMGSVMSRD